MSTALFSLATLELIRQYPGSHLGHFVLGGQTQSVIHYGSGVTVLALIVPTLTWLAGAAAVWLLWRPGLQRVLQAAGLHAGRAQRIAVVPDLIVQLAVACGHSQDTYTSNVVPWALSC